MLISFICLIDLRYEHAAAKPGKRVTKLQTRKATMVPAERKVVSDSLGQLKKNKQYTDT